MFIDVIGVWKWTWTALGDVPWMLDPKGSRARHLGSSHAGHYVSYDVYKISIRFVCDKTLSLFWNGTFHTEGDAIKICSRRVDTTWWRLSMLCHLSPDSKQIATDVWSVRECRAVTNGKTNVKRVELVGEHSLFYGSKEYGYTRKDKIDLVWENIEWIRYVTRL